MRKAYHIQVRFSDVDALGHVNNARFLEYFELARVYYFNDLIGTTWDWNKHGLILARNEIDYLQPVFLNDKVMIHLWCDKIGNKSFEMAYEVMVAGSGGEDVMKARGRSVLVSFDYKLNTTVAVPEEWRKLLE